MVLVLVLSLLLVLMVFGLAVKTLSRQAYRDLDAVDQHLRAVAVGEAAFATVVSRLSATNWSDRWFRAAPDVQRDIAAVDGAYTYILRDAPLPNPPPAGPLPHQADLLVKAVYGRSEALMFWRLLVPQASLDGGRVIPVFFAFPPDAATVDNPDPIARIVEEKIREREDNLPRFDPIRGPLRQSPRPADIGEVLGHRPRSPVVELVPSPDGGSGIPPEQRAGTEPPPPSLPPELVSPLDLGGASGSGGGGGGGATADAAAGGGGGGGGGNNIGGRLGALIGVARRMGVSGQPMGDAVQAQQDFNRAFTPPPTDNNYTPAQREAIRKAILAVQALQRALNTAGRNKP